MHPTPLKTVHITHFPIFKDVTRKKESSLAAGTGTAICQKLNLGLLATITLETVQFHMNRSQRFCHF
jgi:hypothetical protein